MSCKEDSLALDTLKQKFCVAEAAFPATAPLTAEDAAIQTKYGKACTRLSRLTGLQFKGAKHAYFCQSSLVEAGVGVKDALPRDAVLAAFPEAAQGNILARYGFVGKEFAAVVLDAAQPPLLTMEALKPLIVSIDSAEGAMAWAYLQGVLGAGYQPQALCHAAAIAEQGSGWSVEKAEKIISCRPTRWVSFSVNRVGAISITQETDKINPDGTKSAICVD